MDTREKLKQLFKKVRVGDYVVFTRQKKCPDCGNKILHVRPMYPGCTDMVNVVCHKCHSGWGETVEAFLALNPEEQ